jgi:exonuclease SbcD
MQIAITADLHLTTWAENPERYHALENILTQMRERGIDHLIIAGDLFDISRSNYAEFEALVKQPENRSVQFLVLPGNHDPSINSSQIVAPNVRIFMQPESYQPDSVSPALFFLPYVKGKTMGEDIGKHHATLQSNDWILVSHGDWLEGLREENPYESGLYMPLTRKDLADFRPSLVFIGHIHVPFSRETFNLHSPGSPCGLNISETGARRFLIYDTKSAMVESQRVDSDVIFFDETLTILPLDDEQTYLHSQVEVMKAGWGLAPDEFDKVKLRLNVRGYSTDRAALLSSIKESLTGITCYPDGEPDISEVSISFDPDRSILAKTIRERISSQTWPNGRDDPRPEEILQAALEIVYGGTYASAN